MLEQDFGAIDWIAPISPDDIPGPPLDLSPSCHVGPTLAGLGDPTAITAMTPPEYHFGIPVTDLIISTLLVITAICVPSVIGYIVQRHRQDGGR